VTREVAKPQDVVNIDRIPEPDNKDDNEPVGNISTEPQPAMSTASPRPQQKTETPTDGKKVETRTFGSCIFELNITETGGNKHFRCSAINSSGQRCVFSGAQNRVLQKHADRGEHVFAKVASAVQNAKNAERKTKCAVIVWCDSHCQRLK